MGFAMLLVSLYLGFHISSGEKECHTGPYNKYQRPYAGGPAVNITTKVYIRNLNTIDESKFTYNLDYILYYWYKDPRLSTNCTSKEVLGKLHKVDDIWFPNLGLINCHSSKSVQNSEKVVIEPNGNVFAHKRMTTQCYCIMDLTAFPMDTQHCPLRLESYVYSQDDIRLHWHTQAIQFEEGLELVGYIRGKSFAKKFTMTYSYGTWEVMEAMFVFHRMYLHYIYRVYIPIILLMIFNFASYWIPHTAMPARVTLVITTFLTIAFILQSVTSQTAKATTTTSLQIFLISSMILVVVAIVEFLVVIYFAANQKEKKKEIAQSTEDGNLDSFELSDVNEMSKEMLNTSSVYIQASKKRFDVFMLDKIFRYLTPIIYVTFCIIYFTYFLNYVGHSYHVVPQHP